MNTHPPLQDCASVFGDRTEQDDLLLDQMQRMSFNYFLNQVNPRNGLIRDRSRSDSPASIAAVGMALTSYPLGVCRGYVTRKFAVERTLTTLRFLVNAPQSQADDASGHRGFFYHFLDMETGRRVWKCELSTIDTAILMAGVLTVAAFFQDADESECEIRRLADLLYERVDWSWAQNRGDTLTHGWRPRRGFLRHRWAGYDEALILYILSLGSPTHPITPNAYAAHCEAYEWGEHFGQTYIHAGPHFIHQLSHIWIDFRGIQDDFTRERRIDYFENSRRAAYVQRQYAVENPGGFEGYGENSWCITASDGPGPAVKSRKGLRRRFLGYCARGVGGSDDGTLSPWGTITSLPFAPEIVLPALRHYHGLGLCQPDEYGFIASFNPTFAAGDLPACGWVSPEHVAINLAPVGLMIENHRTDFLWSLLRGSVPIVNGLKRAGFRGGWIDDPPKPASPGLAT